MAVREPLLLRLGLLMLVVAAHGGLRCRRAMNDVFLRGRGGEGAFQGVQAREAARPRLATGAEKRKGLSMTYISHKFDLIKPNPLLLLLLRLSTIKTANW